MNSEQFKRLQRTINSAYNPIKHITDVQNDLKSFTNVAYPMNNYLYSINKFSRQLRKASSLNSTLSTIRNYTYPALKLGKDFDRIHDNIQSIENVNSMSIPYNFSQNNFRATLNDYGIKGLMDTINRSLPFLNKGLGINSAYNSISNSLQQYIFNSFNSYDFEEEPDSKQLKEKFNFVKSINNDESQSYLDEFQQHIGSPNKEPTQQQCINANKIIINIYNSDVQTKDGKTSSNKIWTYLLDAAINITEFLLEQHIPFVWLDIFIISICTYLEHKFINN